MDINSELLNAVYDKINCLAIEYRINQALILSEDDLKCHIFRVIFPLLTYNVETMDHGIYGGQLHTEITFYNEQQKLWLKPDITILSTSNLSISHSVQDFIIKNNRIVYKNVPSKGFEFCGNSIVMELKFHKGKNGITTRQIQQYRSDVEKIKRIQLININRSNGENKILGIFVIFSRYNLKNQEFTDFISSHCDESLRIFYGTGDLTNS